MASKRSSPLKNKVKPTPMTSDQVDNTMMISRGPTNIKQPTAAERQDMKMKEYARKRNTS